MTTMEIAATTPAVYIQHGWVNSWATARGSSDGYFSSTIVGAGVAEDGGDFQVYRGFLRFDTSPLSGYVINNVKMRLTLAVITGSNADEYIAEYDWSEWAVDLTNATKRETAWDGLLAAAVAESFLWGNTSIGTNTPTESSDNLSTDYINTAGYTYYGVLSYYDVNNVAPTTYYRHWFCSASHGTAAYKPILVVDYSEPAAGSIATINGVEWASTKTVNGIAVADIKKVNGVEAQ